MRLAEDEVHLWRIATDRPYDADALRQTLCAEEVRRVERFKFERDQRRALVRRAALRAILAGYLGAAPREVKFVYGPRGKPALEATFALSQIQFNLSFSGELALCAVGRSPLGVDVEADRRIENAELVARHFFNSAEIALQDAADDPNSVFLRHWTRKEAVIKATGSGLSVPLDQFDVSWPADGHARQVSLPDVSGRRLTWWVADLVPPAGFQAALATLWPVHALGWYDASLPHANL